MIPAIDWAVYIARVNQFHSLLSQLKLIALLLSLVTPQLCRAVETPGEYLQRAFKGRVMVIRHFYSDANLEYGPDGKLLKDGAAESDFLDSQVLVGKIALEDDKLV